MPISTAPIRRLLEEITGRSGFGRGETEGSGGRLAGREFLGGTVELHRRLLAKREVHARRPRRQAVARLLEIALATHDAGAAQTYLARAGEMANQGEEPALYLIYPEGNCISSSPETPYLQVGESKYGKPILDRVIHRAHAVALTGPSRRKEAATSTTVSPAAPRSARPPT